MSGLTPELLNEPVLRRYAGNAVYIRGEEYYRLGRVELMRLDEEEAHLHVVGTDEYCVDIAGEKGGLYYDCTCPQGEAGHFCKHITAAGLFLRDYLRAHGTSMWKGTIERALRVVQHPSPRSRTSPYLLFFSLQNNFGTWSIQPRTLSINAFPELVWSPEDAQSIQALQEIIEHNPWMGEKVKNPRAQLNPEGCVNATSELVAVANLILRSEGYTTGYYYYSYNRPIHDYLTLLAGESAPIFYGNNAHPFERTLAILPEQGSLEIEMDRTNGKGVVLQSHLRVNGNSFALKPRNSQVISRDPLWIMADRHLIKLSPEQSAEFTEIFLSSPQIEIPPQGETEFLEKYLIPLANSIELKGEQVQWEVVRADPVKRLYLTEEGSQLLVHLRFGYDDNEVTYQKDTPKVSVQRKSDDSWTLLRIHRQPEREEDIYRTVSSARNGLKYGGYPTNPETFELRARVDPIDFLLWKVPLLIEDGFEIYGEENLKNA
ncbi:MAG: hypothetical protein HC806_03615, partial [Anaerolineae bacterium]|nr:hypothetical protein [Anaerolineae bacterium]